MKKIKNYKKHAMFLIFALTFIIAICGTTAAASTNNTSKNTVSNPTYNTVITGNVIQCSNSEPFSGVNITVSNDKKNILASTKTDENGSYSVNFNSNNKVFVVTASYPGHESVIQNVKVTNINGKKTGTANFQLGPRDATCNGLENGYYKKFYIRDYYGNSYNSGTISVTIDGVPYDAYCIDLFTDISSGDTLLVNGALIANGTGNLPSGVDWSKVNYILNHFNANNTINGSTNKANNGAAIQAAIWYFTTAQYGKYPGTGGKYQFMTDPMTGNYDAKLTSGTRNTVRNLAQYMINQANANTFNYPVTINIQPKTTTLHNGNSQTLTVTVYDQNNNPLSGINVSLSTDRGILSSTTGTTGATGPGQFTVNLTTNGLNSGVANIMAWVTGNYGTLLYYDPAGSPLQDLTTTITVPYSIEDSATVTFIPSLELTKTGYYNPYCGSLVWTITAKNYSNQALTNVTINDLINPSSHSSYSNYYVNYNDGRGWLRDGTYNSITGNWTISQIPAGATYLLSLYATPNNGKHTSYTNSATSTENNTQIITNATIFVPDFNPLISQTAVYSNNQIVWIINATNTGPDTADFLIWDEMGYDSPDTSYSNYEVSYDGGNTWVQDGSYDPINGLWRINGLPHGNNFKLKIYSNPLNGHGKNYSGTAVDNYGHESTANIYVP